MSVRTNSRHRRKRAGSFIDSQSEVGGYPSLAENTHTMAVPASGLRDWLDQWALSVEESGESSP